MLYIKSHTSILILAILNIYVLFIVSSMATSTCVLYSNGWKVSVAAILALEANKQLAPLIQTELE